MSNVGNSQVNKIILDNSQIISFKDELLDLIRKYNIDLKTNIPDFVLAGYIINTIYSIRILSEDLIKHYDATGSRV